jgi:hypothetical protein
MLSVFTYCLTLVDAVFILNCCVIFLSYWLTHILLHMTVLWNTLLYLKFYFLIIFHLKIYYRGKGATTNRREQRIWFRNILILLRYHPLFRNFKPINLLNSTICRYGRIERSRVDSGIVEEEFTVKPGQFLEVKQRFASCDTFAVVKQCAFLIGEISCSIVLLVIQIYY